MTASRDLSLTPRNENTRDAASVEPPVQFSLQEIRRHFADSMESVKKQYAVADDLLESRDADGCKTIWRSQVVLAEGLLDFYIHEISKYCLFRMFTGQWDRTTKYDSVMVPMRKVEEAIAAIESKDWFFSYLNDKFSREVFLSQESMREQLNLIGVGFTDVMVRAFPQEKEEDSLRYGKRTVASLFERRNAIAHQNDRSHASAVQNDIMKEFVVDYITKIEAIVDAIQGIVEEKG